MADGKPSLTFNN